MYEKLNAKIVVQLSICDDMKCKLKLRWTNQSQISLDRLRVSFENDFNLLSNMTQLYCGLVALVMESSHQILSSADKLALFQLDKNDDLPSLKNDPPWDTTT